MSAKIIITGLFNTESLKIVEMGPKKGEKFRDNSQIKRFTWSQIRNKGARSNKDRLFA